MLGPKSLMLSFGIMSRWLQVMWYPRRTVRFRTSVKRRAWYSMSRVPSWVVLFTGVIGISSYHVERSFVLVMAASSARGHAVAVGAGAGRSPRMR